MQRHGPGGAARLGGLVLAGSLTSCASLHNGFLSPAGPIAHAERHNFVIVAVVLIFVLAPVLLLTPLIAWHYRLANTKSAFRPQWGFSWILEALIWIPPTLIVAGLAVVLCNYTVRLDPYRPVPGATRPALDIDVVALDWKWLFIYPKAQVATVDQLIVPAGRPVHFRITSGTVMQSLLMPRLAGQIFAMAGMQTQLYFEASKPGSYFGENTQYNGDGFPKDKFPIHALDSAAYAAWMAAARAHPAKLDAAAYAALSRQSVLKQPQVFGQVTPGLYTQILHQEIVPGYVPQHHEPPPPRAHPAAPSPAPPPASSPEPQSHA